MKNRPAILLGNGVRNNPRLVESLCNMGMPVMTTWMAADLIPEDHPAFVGRPGLLGQRAANIIQQKCTGLYVYGARLDGEQVAYDYDRFAPNAVKCIYDVDTTEFKKYPRYWITHQIDFSRESMYIPRHAVDPDWLVWCKALYNRFRPEMDGCDESGKYVDPFYLMTLLHEYSKPDDVFAIGSSGNAPTVFFQAYKIRKGQRVSNVCTVGAMGADVPMALGAALANPGRRVVCVTGDGGIMLNSQELETIRRLRLPVTIFVLNNNGYNSIRVAQKMRFGRVTGADPDTGLTLPSLEAIAEAYRWLYVPLRGRDLPEFGRCFDLAPTLVEVFVDPNWQQLPRVMASVVDGQLKTDNMERMYPYLPEDELREIMEW